MIALYSALFRMQTLSRKVKIKLKMCLIIKTGEILKVKGE